MMKRLLIAVFAVGLMAPLPATFMASIAAAQERTSPAPTPPPPPPARPAAPARPPAPPAPPQAPPPPRQGSQMPTANVQLDVVITDTVSGKPEAKRVTLMLRPDRGGSIRTQGTVLVSEPAQVTYSSSPQGTTLQQQVLRSVELALDAAVSFIGPDLLEVRVTFDYSAAPSSATPASVSDGGALPAKVTENLAVLLRPGRSLLVSRSADPVTNRTVTVELTATIREP